MSIYAKAALRCRGLYLICLIFLLLGVLMDALAPRLVSCLVDKVIAAGLDEGAAIMILLLFSCFLLRGVFKYVQEFSSDKISQSVRQDCRTALFSHILLQRGPFFQANRPGELMSRVRHDAENVGFAFGFIGVFLIEIVIHVVVMLFSLIALSWQVGLVCLTIMPLIGFLAWREERLGERLYEEISDETAALNAVCGEALGGMRTVRSFGQEKREERRIYYLKLTDDFFKDKAIKKLRRMAGGNTYVLIILELFLLSLSEENHLYYDGIEDSFAKEMALAIDEKEDDIKVVLDFLSAYGWLIEEAKDSYYLPKGAEMSGSITMSGLRMRRKRERDKALANSSASLCDTAVTSKLRGVTKYIDRTKEIDKSKDRERRKREEGADNARFIRLRELPSLYPEAFTDVGVILPDPVVDEVRAYQERNGLTEISVDDFFGAFNSIGWSIDGAEITNWQVLYVSMESDARNGARFILPGEEGDDEEEEE